MMSHELSALLAQLVIATLSRVFAGTAMRWINKRWHQLQKQRTEKIKNKSVDLSISKGISCQGSTRGYQGVDKGTCG